MFSIIGSTDIRIHTSRWRQVGQQMVKKHSKIKVGFVNFQWHVHSISIYVLNFRHAMDSSRFCR